MADTKEADARDCVEVVYAQADQQTLVSVPFRAGMSAREAVEQSGLIARYPEISARELVLGIYGNRVELDHPLSQGDRVEICRPLRADPREMRHALLAQGRVMGGGNLE